MGIDKQSDIAANLQIGPTTLGMVRIYVEGEGFELPLDFEPEEALEIAEEIRLAAERAREMTPRGKGRKGPERKRGTGETRGAGEEGGHQARDARQKQGRPSRPPRR